MKIVLALAFGLTLSSNVFADGFTCISSEICKTLTEDQRQAIQNLINDEIPGQNLSDKTSDLYIPVPAKLNLSLPRRSFKGPSAEITKPAITESSSVDVFGNKIPAEPHTLESNGADLYKSFKYNINDKNRHYLLADVYYERDILPEREPYLMMSTIGVGRQMSFDWIIEVAFIKDIRDRNKRLIKDFGLTPSGIMLTFRRRLN